MSEQTAAIIMWFFIILLCIITFVVSYFLNKRTIKKLNDQGIFTVEQQMRWKKTAEEKDLQEAYFRTIQANTPQPEKPPTFDEWKAAHTKKEP